MPSTFVGIFPSAPPVGFFWLTISFIFLIISAIVSTIWLNMVLILFNPEFESDCIFSTSSGNSSVCRFPRRANPSACGEKNCCWMLRFFGILSSASPKPPETWCDIDELPNGVSVSEFIFNFSSFNYISIDIHRIPSWKRHQRPRLAEPYQRQFERRPLPLWQARLVVYDASMGLLRFQQKSKQLKLQ